MDSKRRKKPVVPKTNDDGMTVNAGELLRRIAYATQLGITHGGSRDLYEALGYKKEITFQDYWLMFKRGRLGRRIISAPVESTWRGEVNIFEDDEPDETAFEKAWKELDERCHVTHKFSRLDKLVGLGNFAVLLLGFNDGRNLFQPVVRASDLLYVQPYHQGNVSISKWSEDPSDSRYGLPEMYEITFVNPGKASSGGDGSNTGTPKLVHWTRVLHVAEGLLDNDIFGTPRLENVFNGVQDAEKVVGGTAEMFWQGALGGKAFVARDGAKIDAESMEAEIDEYIHKLRRYMRLQNMDIHDLAPTVSDPGPVVESLLDFISGDTGIPKRILIGSERGELASTQDESNWLSRIKERREQYAEPCIVRPFVDRMISVGVLPSPGGENGRYKVSWSDLWASSAKVQAETAKLKTESLATYTNAQGADMVVPEEVFLEEFLGFSPDDVIRIQELKKQAGLEEEKIEEEARKLQEELEAERLAEWEEGEEGKELPPTPPPSRMG